MATKNFDPEWDLPRKPMGFSGVVALILVPVGTVLAIAWLLPKIF